MASKPHFSASRAVGGVQAAAGVDSMRQQRRQDNIGWLMGRLEERRLEIARDPSAAERLLLSTGFYERHGPDGKLRLLKEPRRTGTSEPS